MHVCNIPIHDWIEGEGKTEEHVDQFLLTEFQPKRALSNSNPNG